jgi:DNA-binding NarL/FixJ family response regulator
MGRTPIALRLCTSRVRKTARDLVQPRRQRERIRPNSILLVDDDPVSRAEVAALLKRAGYTTVEAGTGEQALTAIHEARPALVVMEVALPGASGYEICRELRDAYGDELPIIFLSGVRTEPFDRVAGLLLGADDYIVKPFDADELITRVRRLHRRGAGNAARQRQAKLTPREHEVLGLLVEGLGQSQIARRLSISEKTVAKHIEHILMKLDVHTRAQAVARAVRDILIKSPSEA